MRLIVIAMLFLAGCESEPQWVAEAKAAVAGKMKDPSSVQFQKLRVISDGIADRICGEVNAKNGYGGYTGFKRFFAKPDGSVTIIGGSEIDESLWKAYCSGFDS